MFFERFQTIYEGASVVYSVEAVMNIEEVPDESFNSPVAKEIIEIMKRVSERQDMTYQRPYKIFKVSITSIWKMIYYDTNSESNI